MSAAEARRHDCGPACANAARRDIHRTLVRYLSAEDPEHAAARADGLLDHWAHELANQQRPSTDTALSAGVRCNFHINLGDPPAVAWLIHATWRGRMHFCQGCLDRWFDDADDNPRLEPAAWGWLPGCRPPAQQRKLATEVLDRLARRPHAPAERS
jgi:hypothetical protein